MSIGPRNHHYLFPIFGSEYGPFCMVRRTCNLLITRLVLVPVPCVDCSDAKLFGGFLLICFFSSTTGSSFNIPIVSFNGVLPKLSKFPDMSSGDELFILDWILLEPMTFWSIRGGRIIVQLHWHRLNKQIFEKINNCICFGWISINIRPNIETVSVVIHYHRVQNRSD